MELDASKPLPEQTDQQLVALYRKGMEAAFVQLVQRYQQELFHFLVRFVSSKPQAEDIFQETCLQIHLSIDSFDTERPFKPWLFTIAANKARDYLRRTSQRATARLMAPLDDDGESGRQFIDLIDAQLPRPDQDVQQEETRELVRQVVGSLPENVREILILAYFHSVPYKEIAQRLGIPLGTVKSRLHAAVGTFAQRWKEGQEKAQGKADV